jgi:hypothetical protein
MSNQPAGERLTPDPYSGVNIMLLGMMLLGTLLLLWYALSVAGFIPPPPYLFPAPQAISARHLQVFVYALAAVGACENIALPLTLRFMTRQPGENEGPFAQRRMLIRFGFATAVWIYIVMLWPIAANPGA